MDQKVLEYLKNITREETEFLQRNPQSSQSRFATKSSRVMDRKQMQEGRQPVAMYPHACMLHTPRHTHEFVEVIYMCAGTATHRIDQENEIALKEGDLLILNQRAVHEILPVDMETLMLHFVILPEFLVRSLAMIEGDTRLREFVMGTIREREHQNNFICFHTKGLIPVENLMENLICIVLNQEQGNDVLLQSTINVLMLHLMKHTDKILRNNQEQYEQGIVFALLEYLEEQYPKATLGAFAKSVRQPDYYISKLLKKHTGWTFKECLQRVRMKQALYYLLYTSMPVEEIVEKVGYYNSSYFHKLFRQEYAMTPKKYRDLHKKVK